MSKRSSDLTVRERPGWDLEGRGGTFGAVRILMAVEEHGAGRQLARFRAWPRCSAGWLAVVRLLAVLAAGAGVDGAKVGCAMLGTTAILLGLRMYRDCAAAMAAVLAALRKMKEPEVLVA